MTEFDDRVRLAAEELALRAERQGGITDSDVLDVALSHTISNLDWLESDHIHPDHPSVDMTDHEALQDALFALTNES